MNEVEEMQARLLQRRLSRRTILRVLGGGAITTAAGLALAACGGGNDSSAATGTTGSAARDINILNFALNLEYLEAEFYTYATTGAGIDQQGVAITGTGTAGTTTGGKQVAFADTTVHNVALELAADERAHVVDLRNALGANAIAKPAINLNALGLGFASDTEFLTLSRAFEDVGVSAYAGAAPLISNSTTLGVAAQILAAEAYHAGNIRLQVAQKGITVPAVDAKDVLPPPAGTKYFTLDSNALAITRTPAQVLAIVYAAANATKGGFFPNGVNGSLTGLV